MNYEVRVGRDNDVMVAIVEHYNGNWIKAACFADEFRNIGVEQIDKDYWRNSRPATETELNDPDTQRLIKVITGGKGVLARLNLRGVK